MQNYIVLYWDEDAQKEMIAVPDAFRCMADDTDHAEEQCENAYPGCVIAWVVITDDPEVAYDDYYDIGKPE